MTEKNKDVLLVIILIMITFFSRYEFSIENNIFFWSDSAHYALAIQDYSLVNDRPHLPGYFLHVHLGILLNIVFQNEHHTLIILACLYSTIAATLFYGLVRNWLSQIESFLISLVLVTNPYVWFFGSVPEIYTFDILFSCAIVFIGLKRKSIYVTPLIYTLFMGFRPSSGILLFPLYVFLWYSNNKKNNLNTKLFIISHLVGIALCFSWLIPMTNNVGGITEYLKLYKQKEGLPPLSILQNISALVGYGIYLIFPVLTAFIFLIRKSERFLINQKSVAEIIKLFFAWFLFPFLFFVFYHLAKGYMLVFVSAMILFIVVLINKMKYRTTFLITIIIIQSVFFLFYPSTNIDTEIYFNQSSRTKSKFDIFINRISSTMLMTSSHIRLREKLNREFDCGFKKIMQNDYFKNKKIALEPSCDLILRELQPRYKQCSIMSLVNYTKEFYLRSYGLNQTKLNGRTELVRNAVMVGSTQFLNEYLKMDVDKIAYYEHLVFYLVPKLKADDYINKLDYYFYKERK